MKTLFFSLSFNNVYKNLFFFSDSVFFKLRDLMNKRDDLKIVFILPQGYEKLYERFIRDNFSENYFVEIAPHSKEKKFLQKFFYFFYAHFIFTDTTRMLTTMGMRPGEPPGGGKRYLAPLKFLIAKIFGRFKFFRDKFVPGVFYKFFAKGVFEKIFDKYNPDLVFVGHLFGQFDQALVAEAKKRKVKTLGMISNWDHFDKYYIPIQADRLLVQSDQVKDFGIRYQNYKPGQISVVGYPQFDLFLNKKYIIPRQEILERLKFPEKCKFILYVSGSAYCPDEPDIIEKILKWIDEGKFVGDVYLVIRPYIGGRGADQDFDMKKYESFRNHPRVVFYEEYLDKEADKSVYYFNLMRHADLVIAIYTTALMEAAALDRPLLTVNFDGYKNRPFSRSIKRFSMREHFWDILNSGGVKIADNFHELFEAIDAYLKNPAQDREKRDTLCQRVCYRVDGLASERITEEILKNLDIK